MNNIKKKQPHKVVIIASFGAKSALKTAFMPANLKKRYNSCKVVLFSNSNWAPWAKLMGYDDVKTFKSNFVLKMQLILARPSLVIDLRDAAQFEALLTENESLNFKFNIDAMEYLKAQDEVIAEGLKNYIIFYNGFTFLEDKAFENKKWPYEIEFLNTYLRENNKKILYFYDQKKPAFVNPQVHFVDVNKVSSIKLIIYLEKAQAFYGTDSFLSLLSAVIGTPTTILQGPTRESNINLKNVQFLQSSVPCSPCNDNFECKDNVCMKVFTPKELIPEAELSI
ncbi:MAG: hypothetical protein IPM57_01135 [Oligoflexia bacterium]|nr:hypothetical protein [Oligoflexia bacterium]